MKRIDKFSNFSLSNNMLSQIQGGDIPTGKNSDGMYTDAWIDSNGDGLYAQGDTICFLEPYCCAE